MMRIILTLGGMLFGPVAGFFGTFWVCSLFRPKGDCMWKLDALGYSFVIGVPVGLLICGGIGFWIGYLADTADLQKGTRHQIANRRVFCLVVTVRMFMVMAKRKLIPLASKEREAPKYCQSPSLAKSRSRCILIRHAAELPGQDNDT